MNRIVEVGAAVLTTIVGVAALAVLVSKNANTANVLQAGGQAFSGALTAATGPVTGAQTNSMSLGGLNFGQMGFGGPLSPSLGY